ncbi:hypothetical protein [Streptomyces parvus]|uniref:hypothetical protein n=1 Tax=Streptomyces parvus TaxID=66428 RepID=UPI0033C7E0FC
MYNRASASATHGATLMPRSRVIEGDVEQGYLVTIVRHRSTTCRERGCAELAQITAVPSAHSAIRFIRVSIRTCHVFGMTPREQRRAVEWSETGWVQALGMLLNGDPTAFTVVLANGDIAEWSVRPVAYLSLTPCKHATSSK